MQFPVFSKHRLTLIVLFFAQLSFSQLTNFSLSVTKTDETCTANGTLTFSVANTTAGATMLYSVYQLPNTATPISVQAGDTFGGLAAGTYRVIATQSLNNLSNSQQQDITILNQTTILTYQITGLPERCGSDGKITINAITGNAAQYEIFEGPMIRPLQVSNVFSGLVAGQYKIRVFDNCGEGWVQVYTLDSKPTALSFNSMIYTLTDCNTINVKDQVSVFDIGGLIVYPLLVKYTVFPPSGPSFQITQAVNSGLDLFADINQEIPFYNGQQYSYLLEVTDGCGHTYQKTQDLMVTMDFQLQLVNCSDGIKITPENHLLPYTVSFLSAPPGFVPLQFNADHPGPFDDPVFYYNPNLHIPPR